MGRGGGSEVMCSDIGRLVSMEAVAYGETLENVRVHFPFNQNGNLHTRESNMMNRTRISTFYFSEIGQNTYKGLGTILSTNGLRLLGSHRKGRLVTLTTGINIPSLHGNTACCTVALAS
jgi:hypothetical protein